LNLLKEEIMRRDNQSQYTLSGARFKGTKKKKRSGLNNREDRGILTPATLLRKKQEQMLE
jgi:hypothetical protein